MEHGPFEDVFHTKDVDFPFTTFVSRSLIFNETFMVSRHEPLTLHSHQPTKIGATNRCLSMAPPSDGAAQEEEFSQA